MSDVVRYRPSRVSVRTLREHLRSSGPDSVTNLCAVARADDARITDDMVVHTLTSHPDVFHQLDDGTFAAVPEPETKVVFRRRRPAPPTRRVPRQPRSRPAPPPPPATTWESDQPHTAKVTIDPGALLLASGERLLVELAGPQSVKGSPPSDQRDSVDDLVEVQLFERHPSREVAVYRGRRPVVDVVRSGTETRLVLGPPRDYDWGATVAPPRAAITSGPERTGSSTGIAIARWQLVESELGPDAQAAIALPPARAKAARQPVLQEAGKRLAHVRDNAQRWPEFADWVALNRVSWDPELIEATLTYAVGVLGARSTPRIASLALEILGDIPPVTARYARVMAPHVLEIPDGVEYASALIDLCRAEAVADPQLDLLAAKVAFREDRCDDACQLYAAALDRLSDQDWTDYLLAAESARVDDQLLALQLATERALAPLDDPRDDDTRIELLGYVLGLADTVGSIPADLIARGVGLCIARGPASCARGFYETWQSGMRLGDRLDVLSAFEGAEDPAILQWLLGELQFVVAETSRLSNLALFQSAINQLQVLESLLGEGAHPYSAPYVREINQRRTETGTPEEPVLPLRGQRLTIIGGDAPVRARIREHLLAMGADEVREVAPHWEAHVDEGVIRSQVIEPDALGVLLTDRVGHQEQALLRNLQARFALVQGGPSRVYRELVAYLAR